MRLSLVLISYKLENGTCYILQKICVLPLSFSSFLSSYIDGDRNNDVFPRRLSIFRCSYKCMGKFECNHGHAYGKLISKVTLE